MQSAPYREIPLRARDKSLRGVTLVDAADFDWLNQWRWCIGGKGYVMRGQRIGSRTVSIRMNRLILGLESGDPRQGDHVNFDKLDHRRSNLRIVTNAQNCQNKRVRIGTSSKYRGVTWWARMEQWHAQAFLGGKSYHLGYFADEDEAGAVAAAWRAEHMPFSTT